MQVQDRTGVGLQVLDERAQALIAKANQTPGLVGVFTTFSTRSPQLFVDIDRTKARILGVPIANIFQALQVYRRLGLCQRLRAISAAPSRSMRRRMATSASTTRT